MTNMKILYIYKQHKNTHQQNQESDKEFHEQLEKRDKK